MPAPTEFSVDEILNRVFIASSNTLATGSATGDGHPVDVRTPQEIFNLVFDPTNNRINFSLA